MLLRRSIALLFAVACAVGIVATPAQAASPRNPVVVVAGLSGPAFAYEPFAARLRANGFPVYVYELPGLGFGDIGASAQALGRLCERARLRQGRRRRALRGRPRLPVLDQEPGRRRQGRAVHQPGHAPVRHVRGQHHRVPRARQLPGHPRLPADEHRLVVPQPAQRRRRHARLGPVHRRSDRWRTNSSGRSTTPNSTTARPTSSCRAACPLRVVGHLGLVLDGTVYSIVRQALTDSAIRPNCLAL